MQAPMGQGESTLSSLWNMYYDMEGTDRAKAMGEQLLQARGELQGAVRTGGESSTALTMLLELPCPMSMKYAHLNVHQMLKDNSQQGVVQLRTIPVALGMLEKYGRHLLKPLSSRVNLWRQINFNNSIFKDRVQPMQGALNMMHQMGYSVQSGDGLLFAKDEPDPEFTSQLVADILLARTEMERYLMGKHPHPEIIHDLLPPATVEQVVRMWEHSAGTEATTVNVNPSPSVLNTSPQLHPPTPVSAVTEGETERGETDQTVETMPTTETAGETDRLMSTTPLDDSLQKACDICGETAASLWCRLCDNKQLCGLCDDMWHKHPKRQNHQRQSIASLPSPSSAPQQDPIMGPFGIRAMSSLSTHSRDEERSPTPVSSRQSTSSDCHSRTPPPAPSRTPPPQQIEMELPAAPPPSSHPPHMHHGVASQQCGGHPSSSQSSAPVSPSASIYMHQQQLQHYQHQQRLLQQQEQQQQQRLQLQKEYGALGDYYMSPYSQPVIEGGSANRPPPYAAVQNAAYPQVPVQNSVYPAHHNLMYPNVSAQNLASSNVSAHISASPSVASAENWLYGNVPAEKAPLLPFPQLEPDPLSVGAGVRPAVSVSHQKLGQAGEGDMGMVTSTMSAGAGAGYRDMSLRQTAQRESVKGVVPPSTMPGGMLGNRMERKPSSHQPYASSSVSAGPSSASESSLLKTVLAETDYEKRAAKCDVRLLTLEEDLQEVEGHLNELMLSVEDVTECDDFRTLNRRKARLMKEHRALSEYRRELASLMSAESPGGSDTARSPRPATQIFHPPPLMPASSPSASFPMAQGSVMLPVSTSPTQQQLGFSYPHQASQSPVHPQEPVPISVYHPPLAHSVVQQAVSASYPSPAMQESASHYTFANSHSGVDRSSILPQWQMMPAASSPPSPSPAQSPLYPPPRYQQGDNLAQPLVYGQQAGSQVAGVAWNPSQEAAVNAPGQGPPRRSVVQEYSVAPGTLPSPTNHSPKDIAQCSQQSASRPTSDLYSLLGQPLGMTQIGFENYVAQELNSPSSPLGLTTPTQPPVPSQPAPAVPSGKSTESPSSSFPTSAPLAVSLQPLPKLEVPVQQWECSHCTFINEPGTRVCIICDRTSDNPTLISTTASPPSPPPPSAPPAALLASAAPGRQGEEAEELREGALGEVMSTEQMAQFQRTLVEEQDQVYMEKQEALRQFSRSHHQPSPAPAPLTTTSPDPGPPPPLPPRDLTTPLPPVPPRTHPPSGKPREGEGGIEDQGSADGRQEGQGRDANHRQSPAPSNHASGSTGKGSGDRASPHSGSLEANFVQEGDFSMTMERFWEQKQIKQTQLDGADLMHYIKMGDREGFMVEELEAALSQNTGSPRAAMQWLHTEWNKLQQVVMSSTKAEGQRLEHNDVGELSLQEARTALCQANGDMVAAVRNCVAIRKKLYCSLNPSGSFAREEVLQAMLQAQGDEEAARRQLYSAVLQPFLQRVWAGKERGEGGASSTLLQMASMGDRGCQSVSTSVINHPDFQQTIMDHNIDRDRRIRMILVEGQLKSWGRAEMVIKLLDIDLPQTYPPPPDPPAGDREAEALPYSLEDVVEAVRNCNDRQSARVYLTQECSTCFSNYPMSKIRNLNFCQCKMCQDCLKQNFEVVIREKHVRHWTCPICSHPDLNNAEIAAEYLGFLAMVLQTQVDREVYELFETKVRDWHLQKDPNFRWCAHCGNGFIADEHQLRMECPHCHARTCYSCKKQWEDQHEGLTCAQFEQWKIDNDPSNQAVGLARHLEENGIDCPSCKMRYALAKGGCMHFKCPQCGHEFCSGCYQPFYQRGMCPSRHCKLGGLHAHHPRDCFFYLRDEDIQRLQDLLKEANVPFNTDPPEGQEDVLHCPVIEQKEFDSGKADESCGKDTERGHAGLCGLHYKEYLVGLINRNHIDPIVILSLDEVKTLIKRSDLSCPKPSTNESEANFRKRLVKFIKDKVPLPSRGP